MNIKALLLKRLRARNTDAATAYWSALTQAASTDPSAKAAAKIADQVDAAAASLGRTPDLVARDLELLTQLAPVAGADAKLQRAIEQRKAAALAFSVADGEATELERRAKETRHTAQTLRDQASSAVFVAQQQQLELHRLQHLLAQAGHTDALNLAALQARQQREDYLRTELAQADRELATHRGGTRERQLQSERDAVAQQLHDFVGGATAADNQEHQVAIAN